MSFEAVYIVNTNRYDWSFYVWMKQFRWCKTSVEFSRCEPNMKPNLTIKGCKWIWCFCQEDLTLLFIVFRFSSYLIETKTISDCECLQTTEKLYRFSYHTVTLAQNHSLNWNISTHVNSNKNSVQVFTLLTVVRMLLKLQYARWR